MNDDILADHNDLPPCHQGKIVDILHTVSKEYIEEHDRMADLLRWRSADTEPPTENGRYLVVWLRQKDGTSHTDVFDYDGSWEYGDVIFCRPIDRPEGWTV